MLWHIYSFFLYIYTSKKIHQNQWNQGRLLILYQCSDQPSYIKTGQEDSTDFLYLSLIRTWVFFKSNSLILPQQQTLNNGFLWFPFPFKTMWLAIATSDCLCKNILNWLKFNMEIECGVRYSRWAFCTQQLISAGLHTTYVTLATAKGILQLDRFTLCKNHGKQWTHSVCGLKQVASS